MAPLRAASGEVEPGASTVSALDELYRAARAEFDADPAFADRARVRVVALQAGDEATLASWREIVDESELTFRQIYERLGVLLEPGDSAGESFYNPWLAEVVDELLAAGVAVHSDGAVVVESRRSRPRTGSRPCSWCRSATAATATTPRTSPRCATASATSRPTGSSTSSTRGRRCTSG